MPETVFLIDSYAQIFRSYYAVRALSNKNGEPTNAIFAMMRFLMKLEEDHPGAPGAFVFDKGRPPHRLALAPDYKANRPPCPEDLQAQLPCIRELITAFGWNIIEAEDTEADDLIASLARHFEKDQDIRIISADKDIAQVIDEKIEMLVPDQAGKGFAKRGLKEVEEKFGVPASAIVDYLAMIGDNADNIPGIAGVGPKTAAQLINRFGSIENMLAKVHEIERETLRTKIEQGADLLKKNIELVRLVTTPPAGITWDKAHITRRVVDLDKIRAIAEQKELKSILCDLDKMSIVKPAAEPVKPAEPEEKSKDLEQLSLF